LSWGYAGLLSELGAERPVYGLQASGIEVEAPFAASIEAMAEEYIAAIRTVQPRGPYHLIGMSLGGLIAHSMACRLQQENEEVGCLAFLDSYPPVDSTDYQHNLEELFDLVQFDPQYLKGRTADIPNVVEAAREAGHVLGFLEVEQVERMLRFLKHSSPVWRSFRPGRFRGDVLFFEAIEERASELSPEQWVPYVTGRIAVHQLQCRHTRITGPEQLAIIGGILREYLQGRAPSGEAGGEK
jgi:nonribosomal peptide synthetase DhbF